MIEPFILNLFFTIGLLSGIVGSAFLPSDIYLPWLKYSNIAFCGSSVTMSAMTAEILINSGEYYKKVEQSWGEVNPEVVSAVTYVASYSVGSWFGGNVGHNIRKKSTKPFKVVAVKCNELAGKLKEENKKLKQIMEKTRADEIKAIMKNENDGVKKLNSDSRELIKEINSAIVKNDY